MKNSDVQKLSIIYKDYNKVWCYCPFHNDTKRPNLSISLSDRYFGKYKCWTCGKFGQLTKTQLNTLSLESAAKVNHNKQKYIWDKYINQCIKNLSKYPLLKIGLANELNISLEILDMWNVGYDGRTFIIPMYNENYDICGAMRRFSNGSKKCVTGSQLGVFCVLNESIEYNIVCICEGFSDGASVFDLGINAMSIPHCHFDCIFSYIYGIYDSDCDIIIIPDNDEVGQKSAKRLKRQLEGWDVSIFKFDGAKDIREYIFKQGKDKVKQELLNYV